MENSFIEAVEKHFKNHRIMTEDQFCKIKKETIEDQIARKEFLALDCGLESALLDFTDLP